MSLRTTAWSRLLALVLGWSLVLSVLGAAPTTAAGTAPPTGTPAAAGAAALSGLAAGAALAADGADAENEDPVALEGESTSLFEGLEVPVADIDPEAAQVTGASAEDGNGEDDTAADGDDAEAEAAAAAVPTSPLDAALVRPEPAEATVNPAVTEALAGDEDGLVNVVIELTGSADLEAVNARAEAAGLEAAQEVRARARSYNAGTARAAAQAADAARGQVVVENLRAAGAAERAALIADLRGARPDGAAAGQDTDRTATGTPALGDPVDLWIVNSVGATVDADTLAALEAREDVAHVRLEEQVELPEIQSEPALPTWSLEKVHAPQTWGEYGYRGEGVTVAVLDTGVDFEHPALAGQYRGRDGDHSDSWFVTTGENYPVPGDGNGHGTHVTGSIAGGAPGEIIGVAPDAEWIGVKILTDGGRGGEVGILSGMQWVLAPGGDPDKAPDIASNSWGGGPGNNRVFWEAVAAWRAAGIVPLFANGNDGPAGGTVGNPGGYPHSIGVGATDSNDQIASFSSRGPVVWDGVEYTKPQVSAPGAAIYSAWPQDSGQDYHTISGTSMATPHVSGVAALVLSAAPGLSVDELQEVLEDTARTEQFMGALPNNAYGHGIVDAYAATTRAAHSGLISGTVTGPDGPVAATLTVVDGPGTTADAATGAYDLYAVSGTQTVRVTAYGYAAQEHTVEVTRGGHVTLDVTLTARASATLSGTVTTDGAPVTGAAVQVVGQAGTTTYSDEAGAFALDVPHGTHEIRVQATGYRPWTGEVSVEGDTVQDVALAPLALPGTDTWTQLKANPAGHGLADTGLHAPTLEQQWSTRLGAVMFSSPVADQDSIYQLEATGRLSALDRASGEVRWQVSTGGGQRATPAISADGATLYVTTGGNATLLALNTSDGSTRWTYSLDGDVPTYATPTVVDGTVYVAAGIGEAGSVHAVDAATGERVWRTPIGGGVFFGPAVADGVAVTSSTATGRVVALDTATGAVLWERSDTISISLPAIDAGKVYLGTSNSSFTSGSVLALDLLTGAQVWEAEGHGDTQGSSPVLYDDLVILGSHTAGAVSAYDATSGELVWNHFVGSAVTSSVAVTTSGVVLGASQNWGVYALDATSGERLWEDQLPAPILSSTAVSDDSVVFVSRDGTVATYRSTGTVSGTVTGPDGPVEATVELVGTPHGTTTDPATGAYELRAPAGDYTLRISRYGLSTHTEEITLRATSGVTVDAALTAVGDGAVSGTVTDAEGNPLEGATVTLDGVPLEPATTAADGTFTIDPVAEGDWRVRVELTGWAPHEETVTVTTGETTTLAVALDGFDLAVVADYRSRLSGILRDQGFSVDELTFAEAAQAPEQYQAIVLNGTSGDYARDNVEHIEAILAGADAAGTSIIALDSWGATSGSIDQVLAARGSAATLATQSSDRGRVWLTHPVAHPVTAPIDQDRYPILTGSYHAWLEGYEGGTLATLGSDEDGARGTGIGYDRTSDDSVQVLLPSHSASVLVGPEETWAPGAEAVFVAAVEHGTTAEFGTVALTVTGPDGAVDADVSVVGSFEQQALPGGRGDLFLPAGEHTLRLTAPGMTALEQAVTVTTGGTTDVAVGLTASDNGAIGGTVSTASGAPVPGAQVSVEGGEPVTTGTDGSYLLADLAVGSYAVTASADGFTATTVEGVQVTAGTVTDLDLTLVAAPSVAVVGDYSNRITDFLTAEGIPATALGWEVMEQLEDYDVVILNHPATIPDQQWLDNLAAFDAAGVSVVFPAANSPVNTRGIYELSDLTGNPADVERFGGYGSAPKELTGVVDHPITAGLGEEPVIYLNGNTDAPYLVDYQGTVLATVGTAGTPVGAGIAYDVRTPDSVHVLLSGLFVSAGTETDVEWAPEGRQLFLNAVRYAGSPGLAQVTGSVTDPDGLPVPDARVGVVGTTWAATTSTDGEFLLGLPDGTHTVEISAFGYLEQTHEITVVDGAAQVLDVVLELGDIGALSGTVNGAQLPGTGLPAGSGPAVDGVPVEGAVVRIVGTPLETVTDAQGRYSFPRVEAGEQELEIELDGYIRTLHAFTMVSGAHTEDAVILESAQVGVVGDSTSGVHEGRLSAFLTDWGYEPVVVDWTDGAALAELDMVLVNDPPSARATLPTFLDHANRNDLPVVWTGNRDRGVIEDMVPLYGNPETWVEGSLDGDVTTTVTVEHPLTQGLPQTFAPTDHNRMYAGFTGYSGTTVATIVSGDGTTGDAIAYDGRTVGAVDVLLSTNGATSYGAVGTRDLAEFYFTPETSRSLTNALQWALTADGLGADTRGTVVTSDGTPLEATVTVEETGRTYPAREGDGSYVIPLEPGTWTLTATTFGYEAASTTVTVAEGESTASSITLPRSPGAGVSGTVLSASGEPVAGASVLVDGTEYADTTAADGTFTFEHLPAGEWMLVARAEGQVTDFVDVTVADGSPATAEARLGVTKHLALVGDLFNGSMGDFLVANGYTIERFGYRELAQVDLTTGAYDLAFVNGASLEPTAEEFTAFLDEAAAHDVSLILPSQYGSGSIRTLSKYTGDPESVDSDFEPDAVGYLVGAEHPVLEGYDVGETVTLLTNPGLNQQFQSFAGYSGTALAQTVHPETGTTFDLGLAYDFVTPGSVHLLLGNLGASSYGSPIKAWTTDAERITLNGVAWAMEARQSDVHGTVTGNGGPVEGAEVTVAGTATRAETGPDGAYQLGVASGEVTLEATADGFEPYTATVTVAPEQSLLHDIELTPLAESALTVTVLDDVTGQPVAGAQVEAAGPTDTSVASGADGTAVLEPLLVGDYTLTVQGPNHVVVTTEVTVGEEPAALTVEISPIQVGVLGDVRGDLTEFLVSEGVASEEVAWGDVVAAIDDYSVVVVNGGEPTAAEFDALVAAADTAQVDLVFSGTHGVTEGGLRLLEEHGEGVTVGGQGYRDGPVGLTALAAHPVFADVADPAHIVADDGYYSWLSAYRGESLATLTVAGSPVGTAVAFEQRTDLSGHLLLSFAAVSDYMGPDRGWTEGTEQVVLDSLEWLLLAPPQVPTLTTPQTLVGTSPVQVSGRAVGADEVQILRGEEVLATVVPADDWTYTATVGLTEGENTLVAVAANELGTTESEPLVVALDTTAPELSWTPGEGTAVLEPEVTVTGTVSDAFAEPVTVTVQGEPVDVAADGSFTVVVPLVEGAQEVTVVATDTLGNEVSQTRQVAHYAYDVAWNLAGGKGRVQLVKLALTGADGQRVQVDGAVLELRQGGEVVETFDMEFVDEEEYLALVRGAAKGSYDLRAVLTVDGFEAVVDGPVLRVR
ncbi:carboxypeptidase regulatory-like domain-containing protein [Ornithinimicrobium cavernae]|uniref:carboxypeptidase regulatory-like domain-containing protein n=1 Tax=Ornithinimicrobium cavernae TaxID=2666047 RepID=UPI000D6903C8|nr:carboxypeptidase regulatory-like domain-containing protein [Ornithinimicrobium cavernae]